jgi:hypothetical protein
MGPEHSGHTRIWLLTNGLDGLYRVGLNWGLGTVEAMGVSVFGVAEVLKPKICRKLSEVKQEGGASNRLYTGLC